MLAGGTAHAYTALNNTVDLAVSLPGSPFLIIFLYITESRFIRQCTNGSCTESLALTENNLRIVMGLTLIFTGEIEVNIRLFISFKSKEGFKRNIMAFF